MEINQLIARHKGWDFFNNSSFEFPWTLHINGKLVDQQKYCPDYLNDPRLYMGLFEEMARPDITTLSLVYCGCMEELKWEVCFENDSKSVLADDLGTAICLAYVKLNGLECEGC